MTAIVLGNLKVIVLCLLIGFIALLAHTSEVRSLGARSSIE
jgi:hypothetical protein